MSGVSTVPVNTQRPWVTIACSQGSQWRSRRQPRSISEDRRRRETAMTQAVLVIQNVDSSVGRLFVCLFSPSSLDERGWWVLVAQSCPTLCYSVVDCSPPDSSVHGILLARILEWVAISFSRASSQPKDWTQVSHISGKSFTVWATREAIRGWGLGRRFAKEVEATPHVSASRKHLYYSQLWSECSMGHTHGKDVTSVLWTNSGS